MWLADQRVTQVTPAHVPGVTIGEHSVIGAGAVVTESVPAYHVAAGVPCRLIGKVEVDADGGIRLTYDRDRDRP